YGTFMETGMGQSFGDATESKSAGDFHQNKPVYDSSNQLFYLPKFENKILYIIEYRLDGKDTVHYRKEKIDYIIGSGHHTNSHLFSVNGYVYQAPLTFYTQSKKWDLPPGFEKGNNSRFSRIIGYECMSCHNSLPDFEKGSENKFNQIPKGITCERCHGPGSLHIKEKQEGKIINTQKEIDYTIVNPKKLPWERQVDVCQRCHLQGNAVLHDDKDWSSFRPGMKLSDYIDVYAPKYANGNQIIMASHAQRLQESQCFIKSNKQSTNKLTCITCHNPHISVKKTGSEIYNNACKSCHSTQVCKEVEAIQAKENHNCVACHMPKSGTGDIPHVSVHDHKIAKRIQSTASNAKPVFQGLVCVNNTNPSYSSWSQAWLNAFEQFGNNSHTLDSAKVYIEKTEGKQKQDLTIRQLYLKQNYQAIVNLKVKATVITDGWTAYRCSEAAKNTGNYPLSESYIQQAVNLSKGNLEFKEKLAAVYILNNKLAEAMKVLDELIKIQPKLAMAWCNKGYIYKLQNNIDEAMKCIDVALKLDPDYIIALQNKIDLAQMKEDKKMMIKYIKQLLKLQPNPQLQSILTQIQ
ncbi:MAG: tetratricopeptide repeat protein, partial [Bacteroidetes bacterium]|nr:tetratricopeptide repeat protein [Bacteroidota bacterium]